MTLAEFAKGHPLLLNLRFVGEEVTEPPLIVGLVGGLLFRNKRSENSVIYRMTPHYNSDVFERKELAKQYPNIEYKQKKAVDLFRGKGICYLDINYMYIFNDFVQSRTEQEIQELKETYSRFGFDPRKVQHEIEVQYHGKKCPVDCEQCAEAVELSNEVKQQFVNDITVAEIMKPLFVDSKQHINERVVLVVLPLQSEFAQYCDTIIHIDDCDECKSQFVSDLSSDLHQAYLKQLEDLPNDFIDINIDNDDMAAAVEKVATALQLG
jgi:hypothetical protein